MSSESMPFRNGNQLIHTKWLGNQILAKAESQPAQEEEAGQRNNSTKAEGGGSQEPVVAWTILSSFCTTILPGGHGQPCWLGP